MTTHVRVACPENSHWSIKVIEQDAVGGTAERMVREAHEHTLAPGEFIDLYVHSTRRLVIEEVPIT